MSLSSLQAGQRYRGIRKDEGWREEEVERGVRRARRNTRRRKEEGGEGEGGR